MAETIDFGFQHAPVGLAVTHERIIARCNRRFCEIFGYDPHQLEGQMFALLYPSDRDFVDIGRLGRKSMIETGRYQDERVMKRSDGTLFWARAWGQSQDPTRPFARCVWAIADLSDTRPMVSLTRREQQVALSLLRGQPTKAMARELGISHRTVEVYRGNLLRKFEARNSAELVAKLSGFPL